jgi:hypothetical protein
MIDRLVFARSMPIVELGLDRIALGEQRAIARNQIGKNRREGWPEIDGRDSGSGRDLMRDQIRQDDRYIETADVNATDH